MPSRRTIKKPTRWTAEEWRRIEDAARTHGMPPLRYVREAALAAKLAPRARVRVRGRGSHELVNQLSRVLNNLRQLEGAAEEEAVHTAVAAIRSTIDLAEAAVRAASGRPGSAHPLIVAVRDAGQLLNEVAHQAHVAEELPSDGELGEALRRIQTAVGDVLR